MAEAWHIAKRTRTCAGTGEAIPAGAVFFSALVENDEAFERRDFLPDAWKTADKTGFFSYWRNKGAEAKEEKKPGVDYERILAFFDNLEAADDPKKSLFRYVLALILIRRRRLRLESAERTPEGDKLIVYDRRNEKLLTILAPEATREEIADVQTKLSALFESDNL